MNVKDKFKNAWWFKEFCEKGCLAAVLYDFAPWPPDKHTPNKGYRPLYVLSSRNLQEAYHSVDWDSTYDHQNKLTHEELYEVVKAAFELGYIEEAMETKQLLDRCRAEPER